SLLRDADTVGLRDAVSETKPLRRGLRDRVAETAALPNFSNANIAEREHALMIALEPDVADLGAAELRPCLELGRRHLRFPVGAPQFVLDGLEAVEPMLDVGSFCDDPRDVPVADRLQVARRRRVQAIR